MNAKDAEDSILRVFCNLLLNTCLPAMGFYMQLQCRESAI